MTDAERQTLRALRDCRVVRTRFDHPGFIGLQEIGMVEATPVEDDENALDWRVCAELRR